MRLAVCRFKLSFAFPHLCSFSGPALLCDFALICLLWVTLERRQPFQKKVHHWISYHAAIQVQVNRRPIWFRSFWRWHLIVKVVLIKVQRSKSAIFAVKSFSISKNGPFYPIHILEIGLVPKRKRKCDAVIILPVYSDPESCCCQLSHINRNISEFLILTETCELFSSHSTNKPWKKYYLLEKQFESLKRLPTKK